MQSTPLIAPPATIPPQQPQLTVPYIPVNLDNEKKMAIEILKNLTNIEKLKEAADEESILTKENMKLIKEEAVLRELVANTKGDIERLEDKLRNSKSLHPRVDQMLLLIDNAITSKENKTNDDGTISI